MHENEQQCIQYFLWKNLISRYTWEDNIKNVLKECEQKDVNWIVWPCTWASGMNLQVP